MCDGPSVDVPRDHLRPAAFDATVSSGPSQRRALVRLGALGVLCVAAIVFAAHCLSHLHAVRDARPCSSETVAISAAAFVLSIVAVLLIEVVGITDRFRRPEQQVRLALQRIRAGDVGFRIGHRRGEPLGRLVHECNHLLEWLNRNPPSGVSVDGDVFELPTDEDQERAADEVDA